MSAFDDAAKKLELLTGLSKIQARGTVRLLLKEHDIDPRTADKDDLLRVTDAGLLDALRVRRINATEDLLLQVQRAIRDAVEEEDEAYTLFRDID